MATVTRPWTTRDSLRATQMPHPAARARSSAVTADSSGKQTGTLASMVRLTRGGAGEALSVGSPAASQSTLPAV